ncbi:hypothetical protein JCM16303_006411 [Sporobolomyces ruberrimus]
MASQALTMTTTTQQWVLTKYSRSRPRLERPLKRRKIGDKSEPPVPVKEEFDHFVQPQLTLRLETTRSGLPLSPTTRTSTAPELPITHSMLLKVYYDPSSPITSSSQPSRTHQILLLDSLDLVSFSSPLIRSLSPPDELPLKGVYHREILALRYFSAEDKGFKRVQFKFEEEDERERFMTSVEGIIPFKPAQQSSTATNNRLQQEPKKKDRRKQIVVADPSFTTSSNLGQRGQGSSPPSTTTPTMTRGVPFEKFSPQLGRLPPLPETIDPATTASYNPLFSKKAPVPPASTQRQSISTRLSTLLPRLTLASQQNHLGQEGEDQVVEKKSGSELLVGMGREEFERAFEEVLFEDGFEELVERVQELVQKGAL